MKTPVDFIWPVSGKVRLAFGAKEDGVSLKGIIIESKNPETVKASCDGRVVWADDGLRGYGKTVILEHAEDFSTVYARNSEILVKVGEAVRQGDSIATVRSRDRKNSVELYFELRKKAKPVDPAGYLPH